MESNQSFIRIDGKKYQLVTLDFETYYDSEYTLSGKMNTSEYIRDERFFAHGVGIKVGDKKPLWYTGENIYLALHEIDWSKSALVAHNAAFDGFICSHVYGIKPAFNLDTLSMARAVHGHHTRHNLDTIAKIHGLAGKVRAAALVNTKGKQILTEEESRALGAYCLNDVEDTFKIFWKMYEYVPDEEFKLIDITIRMFTDPVLKIDIPRVEDELAKEVGSKVAALMISRADVKSLTSNPQFAQLLANEGVSPIMKTSPTTGKLTYAFAKSDIGFQMLLTHPNERVRNLAEARLKIKSTIGETRAKRFLEAGKDDLPLPIMLKYSGAHTHRWSGDNKMNLQNLKRGGELRRSIMAPEGHVVVVADSAQIEARVVAWLAHQNDLVEAFRLKRDVYSEFATELFGYPVDRKKPLTDARGNYLNKEGQIVESKNDAFFPQEIEGYVGKVCVLALGFGMGPTKLEMTLASGAMGTKVNLTPEQCESAVRLYRTKHSKIVALWRRMDDIILCMLAGTIGEYGPLTYGKGYIRLPNGLFLQYPGLQGDVDEYVGRVVVNNATYTTARGDAKLYGGLLTENCVQALARVIIGQQILEISKRYRVVTMTHDEIVVVAKRKEADSCLEEMLRIMSTPPDWASGLPLAAEGGWDTVYSK